MKKIALPLITICCLFISSCVKTYNCDCIKTYHKQPIDTFTHTGDGTDPFDVCNLADATNISGTDTTFIDCEPQ